MNRNGSLAEIVDDNGELIALRNLHNVQLQEVIEECFDVLTSGEHTTVQQVCHHLGFPECE